MVVNLTNAGLRDVFRSGVDTPLSTGDTPTVQALNPARGLFVIGIDGTVQVYTQLSAYQAALQADPCGRKQGADRFVASGGTYVRCHETLTSSLMATGVAVVRSGAYASGRSFTYAVEGLLRRRSRTGYVGGAAERLEDHADVLHGACGAAASHDV